MGCGAGKVAGPGPFGFSSGLPDCCTSNPECYKVVAEIPNARLVEMTCPPGGQDKPHEHPAHSMYFVTDCKLSIGDGNPPGDPHEVEIPAGAAPIFPAGAHQVKNVGDKDAKVLFVEAFPMCKPCGDVDGFVSPFAACPKCYKILAENDDWITGIMEMEVGEQDSLHNHKDHLIYVLEGDQLTIFPGGDMENGQAIPIQPNSGIPAPIAAGQIFTKHVVKNTGTKPVKMVFFEMKN
mmetsp:Transcript_2914/g.7607  ORF Transcript_2914/g.7607 Transcript_2914/m.7607 type:complete len:236 (+) Transcript_2914:73-780(+)